MSGYKSRRTPRERTPKFDFEGLVDAHLDCCLIEDHDDLVRKTNSIVIRQGIPPGASGEYRNLINALRRDLDGNVRLSGKFIELQPGSYGEVSSDLIEAYVRFFLRCDGYSEKGRSKSMPAESIADFFPY